MSPSPLPNCNPLVTSDLIGGVLFVLGCAFVATCILIGSISAMREETKRKEIALREKELAKSKPQL